MKENRYFEFKSIQLHVAALKGSFLPLRAHLRSFFRLLCPLCAFISFMCFSTAAINNIVKSIKFIINLHIIAQWGRILL